MGGRKILFIEFLILLFEIYDKIYGICLRKTTIKLVNSIKMIFPRVRRNANEEIKAIVPDDYDGDGTSRNLNTFQLELSTNLHEVSQCPESYLKPLSSIIHYAKQILYLQVTFPNIILRDPAVDSYL